MDVLANAAINTDTADGTSMALTSIQERFIDSLYDTDLAAIRQYVLYLNVAFKAALDIMYTPSGTINVYYPYIILPVA